MFNNKYNRGQTVKVKLTGERVIIADAQFDQKRRPYYITTEMDMFLENELELIPGYPSNPVQD